MIGSATFISPPNTRYYVSKPYYAVSYWDNDANAIAATGIGDQQPNQYWNAWFTSEYIQNYNNLPPGSQNNYIDIQCPRGFQRPISFTEVGSRTWSTTNGISYAISYGAFGVNINLDTTAFQTSEITNTVNIMIDRTNDGPGTPDYIWFRIYTAGAALAIDTNNPTSSNNAGGIEVHIWDKDGLG